MGSSHSLEYSTWEPIVFQMPSKPQRKIDQLKADCYSQYPKQNFTKITQPNSSGVFVVEKSTNRFIAPKTRTERINDGRELILHIGFIPKEVTYRSLYLKKQLRQIFTGKRFNTLFVVSKDHSTTVLAPLNPASVTCNGNEATTERTWRGRDRLYVGSSIFSTNMDNSVIAYVRSPSIRACNCHAKRVLGHFYRPVYF